MATNVYVGLAVCSVNDGRLMQAAFDQVAVSGQTTPDAPSSLTTSAGNGQVTLNWQPVAGATSYTVLRSTTSGGG